MIYSLEFGKRHLWKHKEKGFIVWSEGKHLGPFFSATVVSNASEYKHGTYKEDWPKEEFELIQKNKK